jgi:hypothetical protein
VGTMPEDFWAFLRKLSAFIGIALGLHGLGWI